MKPITYDTEIGKNKPENIRNVDAACPFCQREKLVDIYEEEDHIIWLKNKYPVLSDSHQTVIIEGDNCYEDFSQFSLEKASKVLALSLSWWRRMIDEGDFKSVVYFKNHGPMSGGSLRHPHSQIVGFKNHDYREYVKKEHFQGHSIFDEKGLAINLASQPLIGFYEFNFIVTYDVDRILLARQLQGVVKYVLQYFSRFTESYNIFYYDLKDDEHFYIKVVPRYMTTPLFIGYGIPVVTNKERTEEVIEGVRHFLQYGN